MVREFTIGGFISIIGFLLSLNWVGFSDAQPLQPTTTTTVCTTLATCTASNLNVNAATLRRPTTDVLAKAHIGVFVMHPSSSYQNNSVCNALSQRGFTTLCADSVFTGRDNDYYGYEQHAPGIRAGINYLKSIAADPTSGLPAISKVVIFGIAWALR